MFRRRFRSRPFRRSSPGTTLRWVASTSLTGPMECAAGSASSFDLTPGAPSSQWQGGTTEPTLLRIRGWMVGIPRSAVNLTEGGAREVRIGAVLIYWQKQGETTLDPMASIDLAREDVLYHGVHSWDTRDFAMAAAGTPINPFTVNVAGPGIAHWMVDVKAKRRVRSEADRLIISCRFHELFTQSTPPQTSGSLSISGRLGWSLRFLYRTHR